MWRIECNNSLKFAKEHMRPEKYEKHRAIFDNWYAASEAYFFPNMQKQHSTMQGTTAKPCKVFDGGQWFTYECQLEYEAETREETAREMYQYAKDCGKDTRLFVKQLKDQYNIIL
jgi:hypothetical protein